MKKLFDLMTGDRRIIEKSYLKLYGKRDYSGEIDGMRSGGLKKYILLGIIFTVLLLAALAYELFFPGGGVNITGDKDISIDRPAEGESALKIPMNLQATWAENETLTSSVTIIVRPEGEEEAVELEEAGKADPQSEVETKVRGLVNSINRSSSDKKIILPSQIEGGVDLAWGLKKSSMIPLMIAGALIAAVIIYKNRYSNLKKMEEAAKESIIRELPEFINRLVLLLNAGLVLTSAFTRITESCEADGKEVKSYFYSQLIQIGRSMRETNGSMTCELRDFAARSGVRELMRISNIISDNIDKGAGLVEKLKIESELLWLTKKKIAEEKGRLSETKLTFPLVILLLVLIMITIAPALMEM